MNGFLSLCNYDNTYAREEVMNALIRAGNNAPGADVGVAYILATACSFFGTGLCP